MILAALFCVSHNMPSPIVPEVEAKQNVLISVTVRYSAAKDITDCAASAVVHTGGNTMQKKISISS